MANPISKAINTVVGRYKNKKKFRKDVENEADQIFMKNYSDRYKEFPAINESNMDSKYAKDYKGVYDQVYETRKNKKYKVK
jgi:hypothetical protein